MCLGKESHEYWVVVLNPAKYFSNNDGGCRKYSYKHAEIIPNFQ
jgi:hypothetical protein